MSVALDVTRLIDEHRPQLYAFCAQFRDDPHDRDELAQLVMIRAWRGRFDGRSSFTTWLFQIVRRTAATEYGRKLRYPVPMEMEQDGIRPLGSGGAAAVEDTVAFRDEFRTALTELDARFRRAVELVDLWGYSHAEAAELCGVPEATIRTRLFRGRRALRARLTAPADG